MEQASLPIEGMSCGHCVRGVTRALEGLEGLEVEQVEIGSARVRYDSARTTPERIAGAVEEEGYTVRDWRDEP